MARFVYRMQSILDLKYKTEGQAKTEFGIARRALDDEEERLQALYERKNRYFEDGRRMRESQALPVRDIMQNDEFLTRMDEMIEAQILAVKRAEAVVEEKREILTREMQERQMQERLRERAYEEYLQEEKAQEMKELDERSSFVYGNRT
ncbi:MAG: flagellar export protein FliJ [Lachnospiraceae bacterium]|nr:flagellar export protein FliJ [Lachnospiraceae bacterium]